MNQKKIKTILLILLLALMWTFPSKQSEAAVHFITKTDKATAQSNQKPCQLRGFYIKKSDCTLNRTLIDKCPEGDFWKLCRCDAKYKYNKGNCAETMLGGEICNNTEYTECGCDEAEFPFTKENCPSPKVLTGTPNCNNTNFKECSCPSDYKICPAGMIGDASAEKCDNKYNKCKCDPTIYFNCYPGKGAAGAQSCKDDYGTKYTNCEAAPCPSGTVDFNTYWNGELKYFIDQAKRVKTVNGRLCATLPACSEIGFNMNCGGKKSIKCPFDTSKEFCLQEIKESSCADGGYVEKIPSGQICSQVTYLGKACYSNCYTPSNTAKASCSNESGYYKNRSCSEFSAYTDGQKCHMRYNELGNQCYHNGGVGEGMGACDVDSWHRCCLECSGNM